MHRRIAYALPWAAALAALTALLLFPGAHRLAGAAAQWLQPGQIRGQLNALLRRWGPWAPAVAVLLMIVHTVVPFPAEFLAAATGAAFGLWEGVLIQWIGTMASAVLGFGLARALGRPVVERFVPKRTLARADALVAEAGWEVALLARFFPIPGDIVGMALGLTPLPWTTYLWTTAVAILPWTVVSVAAGAGAAGARGLLPWALGGLALLNAAGFLIEVLVRRRRAR
jgi:uncharacterized membrane protein YdjX (TVP38/TMEM64 family)